MTMPKWHKMPVRHNFERKCVPPLDFLGNEQFTTSLNRRHTRTLNGRGEGEPLVEKLKCVFFFFSFF